MLLCFMCVSPLIRTWRMPMRCHRRRAERCALATFLWKDYARREVRCHPVASPGLITPAIRVLTVNILLPSVGGGLIGDAAPHLRPVRAKPVGCPAVQSREGPGHEA